MHVVFASSEDWGLAESFKQSGNHQASVLVCPADELSSRLARILPDIVVLKYSEESFSVILDHIGDMKQKVLFVPFLENPSPKILLRFMRMGIDDVLLEDEIGSLNETISRRYSDFSNIASEHEVNVAKKIAFVSAKGGDGSTFLLANFASALAMQSGAKVLIVDLAIPFGDIDVYLSAARPQHDLYEFVEQLDRLDRALFDVMVHDVGENLNLISSPDSMDRIIKIKPGEIDKLVEKSSALYDYIIFDFGSAIGPTSLPVMESIDQLVLVTRPNLLSARRANQMIGLLADLEFPLEKLVVASNQFDTHKSIDLKEFEKAIGQEIHHRIPDAGSACLTALIQSKPAIQLAPQGAFARAINNWAGQLTGNPLKGRKLWGLFGTK